MHFNIENIDTSTFVCLQLKDSSLYFGQIAYFDDNENIVI